MLRSELPDCGAAITCTIGSSNCVPSQPASRTNGHFMRFGLRFLTGVGLPLPPCSLLAVVSPAVAAALETAGGCTS